MSSNVGQSVQDRGGLNTSHRGELHWPGVNGIPVRGYVPQLRGEEVENSVHFAAEFYSKLFRMWDPADKAEFDVVMNRMSQGWYRERLRVNRWSDSPAGLVVWLEWLQLYAEYPNVT